MADQCELWQWLIAALTAAQPAALLVVAGSVGSSPGKAGAKMAVSADGCIGTIGGGAIESGLMKIARTLLMDDDGRPQLFRRVHHPATDAQASGMICGGEQTVLIYPCRNEDKALFEQCLQACRLRTPLELSISASGLNVAAVQQLSSAISFEGGESWCYRETLGLYRQAYIVGGGHVGLALSKLLDWLNFDITVIDERETPETMRINAFARQKWTMSYADIAEHIPEGQDVFVFVMTHSHHSDEQVVARLAGKQFAYLGLLGSERKIAQLKTALAKRLSKQQLDKLRAPMGLTIGSHTPEEIAISIAAEVIQLLNAGRQRSEEPTGQGD